MRSILPSAIALGLVALLALALATRRRPPSSRMRQCRRAAWVLGVTTAIQAIHLAEETVMGFHERFPAVFDLPPIPLWLFLGFNLFMLGAWVAAVPGLLVRSVAAFFAAWFLALAAGFNGIAHPVLAIVTGGYFPGLLSAPVLAVAGVVLGTRLRAASRPDRMPS